MTLTTIHINVPDRHYDVLIARGLAGRLEEKIKQIWTPRKIAVVSDSHVAPLYQAHVVEQLINAGFSPSAYQVPAGEPSKSWAQAVALYRRLAADHFTRTDGVLALGGGVIGDLAGFVASTFMRGLALIQVPTSLLAQVDSSVGGKTAIDLDTGKNLIGTFYQPDAVFIDPDLLNTLPRRDLTEGYAEIVKMAALQGKEFWKLVERIRRPTDILAQADALITASVTFKATVVIEDEKENGRRQILNFGHTIGHAIELISRGELLHGEAVGIGMVQLSRLFEHYRLSQHGLTAMLQDRLKAVGLPVDSPLTATADFYEKLRNDKKNHGRLLNLVYLKTIGSSAFYPIPINRAERFFSGKYFTRA
jgi:3-dehydroquinate synthase